LPGAGEKGKGDLFKENRVSDLQDGKVKQIM
jgi:hypothetical protein